MSDPLPRDKSHATVPQQVWLRRGLDQPGGKLPLFDGKGKQIDPRIVQTCLKKGWAEAWFSNPLKPDWLVCKLTEAGRCVAQSRPLKQTKADAKNAPARLE